MRTFLPVLLTFVALAAVVTGCGDDPSPDAAPSLQAARAELRGAPPPLAALHAQANELLDGGAEAFEERLAELRGHPVVVNKWGSWCGPCIEEFPVFQRLSVEYGKRVAFLGVDVLDSKADGRSLLEEFPVAYPSYWDRDLKVSAVFNGVAATPVTAFYDSDGELAYLHQGPYREDADLAADIRRYAR